MRVMSPKYYDNILSVVAVLPLLTPIRLIFALFTVIDPPADVLTEVSPQSSVAGNTVASSRVFMQKIIHTSAQFDASGLRSHTP